MPLVNRKKTRKPREVMPRGLRMEAIEMACEMIAQVHLDGVIVKKLRQVYKIPDKNARDLLREATKRLQSDMESLDGPRRMQLTQRLDALYRAAFKDRKWQSCVEIVKLQARMWGLLEPERVEVNHSTLDYGFDGRSATELEHYAKTGRWPEEDQQRPN